MMLTRPPLLDRYPYNLDFDYGALDGLNRFSINNLGDPFIESNYGVHSREFEVSWCSIWPRRVASPDDSTLNKIAWKQFA